MTWWIVNRLGIRRSPVDSLERLVGAGSDVLVIAGRDDAFRIQRGAVGTVRKLARSGRLRFDVIDDLDHALLGAEDAPRVSEIVYSHVLERFGGSDTVAKPSHPSTGHDGADQSQHLAPFGVVDVANGSARVDDAPRS